MTKPSLTPARWTPPPASRRPEAVEVAGLRVYQTSGYGTEDVLLTDDGWVLTGVDDGRILAIDPASGAERVVVNTNGRPLGIEHHPAGGYVVCDSTRGLLHFHASGDLEVLTSEYEGRPFKFCNNAAVAADGTIYFTDSSTKFGFDHWRGDLLEHRPTGRLFKRATDGTITLVADGFAFANGVALAPDDSWVVVAQTGAYCLTRIWLTGPNAGQREPFGPTLTGFPDNISTGQDGNIWVAIASPRDAMLDRLLPAAPWIRTVVWALPQKLQPQPKSVIDVVALDAHGQVTHALTGQHPDFGKATGVRQVGSKVWLGSFEKTTIAVFDLP
jgi:sugar lactone lactonase YvrE